MNAVQLKMARVALGLTVRQAAEVGGVSHDTITRMEAGEILKASTIEKVRTAMESAGVEFIAECDGRGVGVRFKQSKA